MPPPMSPPPYTGPRQPFPQQSKSNGWAIVSLILGILGCVPFVTSLAAVITGFVGISASKPPSPGAPPVGGKGMAIAGIILGFLGLLAWTGIAGVGFFAVGQLKGQAEKMTSATGGAFLTALADGDSKSASQFTTGTLTQADLGSLQQQLRQLGKFQSLTVGNFDYKQSGSSTVRITASGNATFANGSRAFDSSLIGSLPPGGEPSLKIEDFKLK